MARKKKEEGKVTYPLWLKYSEKHVTINDTYGEDGPYTGFSEEEIEFHPEYLKSKEPEKDAHWNFRTVQKLECECEFDPKDCKKLYLVVVRYTDGGTFGSTKGYWTVKGIFKDDDSAHAFKKLVEDGKCPKRTYESHDGSIEEMHHEWEGYFASLDGVEVHRLEVD
jgi:hypothetical protein